MYTYPCFIIFNETWQNGIIILVWGSFANLSGEAGGERGIIYLSAFAICFPSVGSAITPRMETYPGIISNTHNSWPIAP